MFIVLLLIVFFANNAIAQEVDGFSEPFNETYPSDNTYNNFINDNSLDSPQKPDRFFVPPGGSGHDPVGQVTPIGDMKTQTILIISFIYIGFVAIKKHRKSLTSYRKVVKE